MIALFVIIEVQGIGQMGHRGRIGHGMAYDEKLRMLAIRWVLVGETGQAMVVRLIGWEPRPGLGETRADPPAGYPSQAGRGPADRAGLPEGAAIARRQYLRREATAPIDFSRRGTLRAGSGGSRLIRCNAKTSGRKL